MSYKKTLLFMIFFSVIAIPTTRLLSWWMANSKFYTIFESLEFFSSIIAGIFSFMALHMYIKGKKKYSI